MPYYLHEKERVENERYSVTLSIVVHSYFPDRYCVDVKDKRRRGDMSETFEFEGEALEEFNLRKELLESTGCPYKTIYPVILLEDIEDENN